MRNVFSGNGKAMPEKSGTNFVMWNALSVFEAACAGALSCPIGRYLGFGKPTLELFFGRGKQVVLLVARQQHADLMQGF